MLTAWPIANPTIAMARIVLFARHSGAVTSLSPTESGGASTYEGTMEFGIGVRTSNGGRARCTTGGFVMRSYDMEFPLF
jgi:hypothetical protein